MAAAVCAWNGGADEAATPKVLSKELPPKGLAGIWGCCEGTNDGDGMGGVGVGVLPMPNASPNGLAVVGAELPPDPGNPPLLD